MLNFDENGYITPSKLHLIAYESFVETFVTNEYRWQIFQEYLGFLDSLKTVVAVNFYQWVNGSFVSLNPKPADIDVVTFLEYKVYEAHEPYLRNLKRSSKFVDGYFVKVIPKEHPNHFLTNFDQAEWMNLFSTDRKKHKKGFVQINF